MFNHKQIYYLRSLTKSLNIYSKIYKQKKQQNKNLVNLNFFFILNKTCKFKYFQFLDILISNN